MALAAAIRRVGGDTMVESQMWTLRTLMRLTEETAEAAATKLGLAALSGGGLAGCLWLLVGLPLGDHSLVGWLWAALAGVWALLVWRPSHSLLVSARGARA